MPQLAPTSSSISSGTSPAPHSRATLPKTDSVYPAGSDDCVTEVDQLEMPVWHLNFKLPISCIALPMRWRPVGCSGLPASML